MKLPTALSCSVVGQEFTERRVVRLEDLILQARLLSGGLGDAHFEAQVPAKSRCGDIGVILG